MSRRNSREEKLKRSARQAITAGTRATSIDLIEYVKLRTRCTTGEARRLLLAGALKVESHPVGYKTLPNGRRVLQPYIDAKHRDRIIVTMPEGL